MLKILKKITSSINKDLIGKIDSIIKENSKPLSTKELLNKLSPVIDEEILRISQKEELKPLGGEIFISIDDKTQGIHVEWDFFFFFFYQTVIKKNSRRVV